MTEKNINFNRLIQEHVKNSLQTKKIIETDLADEIHSAINLIVKTFASGNKLLIAGTGGSAADAQHIAAEFVVRLSRELERSALPAISLATDSSILTVSSNDNGYETIFRRQLEASAKKDDCFLAISTSGNSDNLVSAVEYARQEKIRTIGLLCGNGGHLKDFFDIVIVFDQNSSQHVQEAHICIYHIICDLVERSMYSYAVFSRLN